MMHLVSNDYECGTVQFLCLSYTNPSSRCHFNLFSSSFSFLKGNDVDSISDGTSGVLQIDAPSICSQVATTTMLVVQFLLSSLIIFTPFPFRISTTTSVAVRDTIIGAYGIFKAKFSDNAASFGNIFFFFFILSSHFKRTSVGSLFKLFSPFSFRFTT